MNIVIIEGYDNFSNERYIKDVKLTKAEAIDAVRQYKPNGTMPDSYHINECTLEDLAESKVKSVFTNEILDEIDYTRVKTILEESKIENKKLDPRLQADVDYDTAKKLNLTNINRWENGINHHPMSERIVRFLAKHDFQDYGDYFCWSVGGDGDNGETLMYQLDAFFEMLDKENEK